jgi:hypothetical protein
VHDPQVHQLIAAAFATLLLTTSADADRAAVPDVPGDIIAREGALVVSDGSSYFRFEKGGAFHAGPLGMSGRTIDGTYTSDGSYMFTIEGTWGWINGASMADDHRRMVVGIQPPFEVDRKTTAVNADAKKIYRCYWTVDELVKLPKAPGKPPAKAPDRRTP